MSIVIYTTLIDPLPQPQQSNSKLSLERLTAHYDVQIDGSGSHECLS